MFFGNKRHFYEDFYCIYPYLLFISKFTDDFPIFLHQCSNFRHCTFGKKMSGGRIWFALKMRANQRFEFICYL